MKRSEAQTVGEIVRQFLQQENLEDTMLEQQIVQFWPKVVGPVINRYTVTRFVKDHKLVVYITSAAMKNELMMYRSKLVKELNALVNKEIINEVIIK